MTYCPEYGTLESQETEYNDCKSAGFAAAEGIFMIHASDLTLSYGFENIIENAEFHIGKGEAAVLIGENGSGKSTLLYALAGAMKPKNGSLSINGTVGYVPQGSGLMEELTFSDNIRFFAALSSVKVPKSLPFHAEELLNKKISDMSGGMKKLCSIVCTVIAKPQILLLDEPCAFLDKEHREMLTDFLCELKENGITIVYVGHNSAEYAPFADKYILIGQTVSTLSREAYEKIAGGSLV